MPSRRPLAVLGGTFDPPHVGHLVLGECVAAQFDCDVQFVPAGDPYRKTGTDTAENRKASIEPHAVTSGSARLEMVELAINGNPKLRADAREIRRAGPSYTVDSLRELHDEGHTELILVLGSDALADMPNWREPDEILRLARIVIAEKELGASTGRFQRIDMPLLRISSTEIRRRVAEGRPIRYLVPASVERFISERQLYLPH
jgi:nicotinate-nucleotide adenylyltransferase